MVSTLSNLPDILHVQHQFFEISQCFGLFKGKNTLFPKVLKKWSSCQNNIQVCLEGEPGINLEVLDNFFHH